MPSESNDFARSVRQSRVLGAMADFSGELQSRGHVFRTHTDTEIVPSRTNAATARRDITGPRLIMMFEIES